MSEELERLIERTRAEQGPFFVARIALRLSFPIDKPAKSEADLAARVKEFLSVCRELGYDPRG